LDGTATKSQSGICPQQGIGTIKILHQGAGPGRPEGRRGRRYGQRGLGIAAEVIGEARGQVGGVGDEVALQRVPPRIT